MNIKICPECGGKVSKTLKECPHCGHYFKKTKKCPDCEEQIEFDLDICPICGHVFNKKKKVKQEEPLEDDNDIVEEIESIEDDESKEEKIVKPTKIINNEDLLTHSSKCPYCGSNTQIDLGDGIFECLICHNTIVNKPIHKNKIVDLKTLNVEQEVSIETKKDSIDSIGTSSKNAAKKSNEINNEYNDILPKKHIIRSIFIWLVLALDVTCNIVALILVLASPSMHLPILDIVFSICINFAIILAIMQIVIHSKEKKRGVKYASHTARKVLIVLASIFGIATFVALNFYSNSITWLPFIICCINILILLILIIVQAVIYSKEHNQPSNGGKKKKGIITITSLLIVAAITATLLAIYLPRCANKNAWLSKADWWNYCSNGKNGEQATESDIGREVDLTVNNQIHKVRLIGIEHDGLYNSSGKAHCTFEFVNLLSDSNGYSLATLRNTKNGRDSTNYDYLNSDIRKALDGRGTGTLRWYQKKSGTKSTNYTKSVIEMLPSDLQRNIKTVKKYVATTSSYVLQDYDAKVFALTHNEMTQVHSDYVKNEGTTYQYYKDHDNNSSRIKHQIRWHDGAATSPTTITDPDITWGAYHFAGYNSSTDSYGGYCWLASPSTNNSNGVWYVYDGGVLDISYSVYYYAFAVAPAFCI